jgi:hypothetical protein
LIGIQSPIAGFLVADSTEILGSDDELNAKACNAVSQEQQAQTRQWHCHAVWLINI